MIKLSAFADEADSMLDGQIEALKRHGIEYIELRGINGVNISKISLDDAKKYKAQLDSNGIKVSSIGSPLGKEETDCDFEAYKELVEHVCRLAVIFGTKRIRVFSFYHSEGKEEKVCAQLREMVKIASLHGVELYHENEKLIFGDTVERVLTLHDKVAGLKLVYDPANFIEVGEDSAHALSSLHSLSGYFHIKDVIKETGELVPAGFGDGRINELIARISPEGETILTLEPHLAIFEGYSEIDKSEMKNKFSFANNNEAFDAAVSALKKLLEEGGYTEKNGGFYK